MTIPEILEELNDRSSSQQFPLLVYYTDQGSQSGRNLMNGTPEDIATMILEAAAHFYEHVQTIDEAKFALALGIFRKLTHFTARDRMEKTAVVLGLIESVMESNNGQGGDKLLGAIAMMMNAKGYV